MVLARVASYLFPSTGNSSLHYINDGREGPVAAPTQATAWQGKRDEMRRQAEELRPDMISSTRVQDEQEEDPWEGDLDTFRPPYLHAMLAGGIGGTTGDMLMHSLDTVKTRQQGDPHMPPKYTSMGNTYYTIFRQEGLWRGLYGGVTPAFLGSFGGTVIFFGCYEASKRYMIDHGVRPWVAYLTAGFFADLAASPLYVPTEVLKTRLQLQGRWNNPFFTSGYNYRSTVHALRTIYRVEGLAELFSGYKATLFRDLPFSALQFAFYEQEQKLAKSCVGPGKDIGLTLEILTGASAGGMAGVLTCPMDVVKTRIQTELDPEVAAKARQMRKAKKQHQQQKQASQTTMSSGISSGMSHKSATPSTSEHRPTPTSTQHLHHNSHKHPKHPRPISTSGPSTALKHHGQVTLDTESVIKALRIIYQTEGIGGWFRGVGPRAVWTSIQSGTMLVVYQKLLRWFDAHPLVEMEDVGLKGYSVDI
ncbi:hypothetical protein M433DRAFT_157175 [Acidomyces richmondensis BFW]|nr:MAG: hypothetical protein FE78DRAFT_94325 [Acidomyces sp. 'richmondensis']KYG43060.1 hypothetical protein M433DRAFT_157175 [Acidomyces richmondensis BFW]